MSVSDDFLKKAKDAWNAAREDGLLQNNSDLVGKWFQTEGALQNLPTRDL